MKHSRTSRLLSIALAVLLTGSSLPLTTLAAEASTQQPTEQIEEMQDTSGYPEVSPGESQETKEPEDEQIQTLAGEQNLALGCTVTVSGGTGGNELTDGDVTVAEGGWISENLKSGTTPGQEQTPVWAVIDLGTEASTVSSIVIQWRNNKVWATNYEIQTADTNGENTQWTTVATVDRDDADRVGNLHQGEGQNIANEATYRDTITMTSTPALNTGMLKRYVRFEFDRVNDLAPGHNLNIAEIQIMGTVPTEPDESAPTAPGDLTAEPTSDGAVLTWTASQDDVGVAEYRIYLDDASSPTGVTAGTTYTLTGLSPETEYTAKVTAADASGKESEGAPVTFTTNAAPAIEWDVDIEENFEDGINSDLWADKHGGARTAASPDGDRGQSFDAGQEQTALVWSSEDILHGVISVWYYDTMQTTSGVTLHVAFVESADAPGKMAGIGINGRQNSNQYMMRYPGAGNYKATGVPRSEGWHEFKWDCSDGKSMKMYIDGKLINTATDITSFSKLTFGDDWTNPAGVAPGYYDDISIQGNIYVPPVDAASELDKITELPDPAVGDTKIALPEVAEGFTLAVVGSELEQIVSNDGTILGTNIGSRDVTLLLEVSNDADPEDTARKNLTVTIPDHSGSAAYEGTGWFEQSGSNPVPGIVPSVQEWYGYDGAFTLSASSRIVLNDAAKVGLDKVAANMVADVEEISGITLTIVSGTAADVDSDDIYIESQAEDIYQTGKEGYLLVTDETGLRIYSSTYTGCLYGTISAEQMLWLAEDHVSIPMGVIRDFPAYEVRGLYLDIARTPYRIQQVKDYAKMMLWYKMNEYHLHLSDCDDSNNDSPLITKENQGGFFRLESNKFPSLVSDPRYALNRDLTNHDYFENLYGNPQYTKEEWKELEDLCADYGLYVLPEFDMPGHSLIFNKYADEAAEVDGIDWLEGGTTLNNATQGNNIELLDIVGANKERATRFAQELFNEYTEGGDDAVFGGDIIHIGTDEYWSASGKGKPFIDFSEALRQTIIDENGKEKLRSWSSLEYLANGNESLIPEGAEEVYQVDLWSTTHGDPQTTLDKGYGVVNVRDKMLYSNPGRSRRDITNAEWLFYNWDPTVFDANDNGPTYVVDKGIPNLLGAKFAVWGDQSREGMIEQDLNQRILRGMPVISEKIWGGTRETDTTDAFAEFELRANKLSNGPGTQIAMEVESESSLVLDYDFSNVSSDGQTVYDASGNGYDAALTGGTVSEDGYLTFDGNTLVETPLQTLSYPYTVSFNLKLTADDVTANAATYDNGDANDDANLFSGYDGQLQVAGHDGNLSGDVLYYVRDFHYAVPAEEEVTITLVGTLQGTKLYVNGELKSFLSTKTDAESVLPDSMRGQELYSSFVLPLEKIGENLHGSMANIKVYNKALSAEEVKAEYGEGTKDSLVNVAQDTSATGYSGTGVDQAINRMYYPAKAIDGDGFDYVNAAVTGDTNKNSEIFSAWYGFENDSFLLVDLGQERTVSQFDIQWKGNNYAREYRIEVSQDGETWDTVYTGNSADRDSSTGVSHVTLDTPVSARYVKLQGVARVGSQYAVQEFLVYEDVDKSELETLLAAAEKTAAERGLSFESTGSDGRAFDALVFARAVAESPLATWDDVNRAIDGLEVLGAVSSDATLRSLSVNGKTLPDFSPEQTEYNLTIMPPETGAIPSVTATPTRQGASVEITGVGALPCQVKIKVTAPDGVTTKTYTIEMQKGQYRTVGYCFGAYGDDNAFYDVDPTKLTHLVYAFGQIYHDEKINGEYRPGGTVVPEDQPELLGTLALSDSARSDLSHMSELKEQNPELKIMLSVGGGTCPGWAKATADADARKKFIDSCVAAVEEYHLDGIDLDWEFPGHGNAIDHNPNDKENFESLIREMRAALGDEKLLTIAASSKDFYLTESCNLPAVIDELDFVNVMSYTMTTYPTCYHNSALHPSEKFPAANVPLESCDEVMEYYTSAGIAPEKLNVGTAFFSKIPPAATKSALDLSTLQEVLGITGITMNYQQLLEKVLNNPDSGFVREWDEVAMVPYLTYPDKNDIPQFAITYEDPESLQYKAQFIQQNNYGGAVIWQLRQDYETILQTALSDALNGTSDVIVTFDSQGGSAVGAINAKLGSTILRPEDPVRDGYTFGGWYRESTCDTPWNFETDVVESDLTLYALWTANSSGSGSTRYTITVEDAENGSVRSSVSRAARGASITLTVTPDEGYELERLTVTDGNGKSVTVTDRGDGRYVFTMPRSNVTVEAAFAATGGESQGWDNPFTDVEEDDWFYDAVEYVCTNGMMQGTGSTMFSPEMTTTRGMIVTILYRMEGEPAVTGAADFDDVSAGQWYSDAVAWASANGIVDGYGNGSFGPEDIITREQAAAILYRYAGYKTYDVTATGELNGFADADEISGWAEDAMSWAVGAGLLNGKNGGLLDPTGTATRAEAAAILARFCQNFAE